MEKSTIDHTDPKCSFTLVLRQAPRGSYVKPQSAITASSTSCCWIIQVVPNLAGPKPNTTQRL